MIYVPILNILGPILEPDICACKRVGIRVGIRVGASELASELAIELASELASEFIFL